jgi:hypothetical protein
MDKPKLGKYKHFKGNFYRVLGTALQTESREELVIYEPLYDTDVQLFARPLAMFTDEVEVDGKKIKRFEYTGE